MKHAYLAAALLLLACLGCSRKPQANLDIRSEAELRGLTLAARSGSYYTSKYFGRDDLNLYIASTEADAVQAVRQGLADVYVGDEIMLTREDQQRLGIRRAFRGEESFDVAFALQKGNEALRSQLNIFLASAPLDSIIAHWIEGGPEVEEPPYEIAPDAAPLRCVCSVNVSPVSFVGDRGQWEGIDPDILRRFAHAMGRPFEMVFQDQAAAVIALQNGQADVMSACLFVTEERKRNVDFSNPYYACRPGYFVLDREHIERLGMGERLRMNLVTDQRWKLITNGLLETVKITLLAILLGTFLGIGVCACKFSRRRWVRSLITLYGSLMNGIPNLVMLLFMFYVVFSRTGLNASLVAVITFALFFASSSGSIFYTAISAIPKGQTEAGLALGFTPFRTFNGIVFPQALRRGLPLYKSECVSLLKSTSIVGYIAIQDLTRASDLVRSRTFDALLPLLIITVLYFLLAWIIRLTLNLLFK